VKNELQKYDGMREKQDITMDESQQSETHDESDGQPKRLSNRDVAAELALIGDILQILDANRFRVIAFQNAAEAIRTYPQDINSVHRHGKLQSIPGVGNVLPMPLTSFSPMARPKTLRN